MIVYFTKFNILTIILFIRSNSNKFTNMFFLYFFFSFIFFFICQCVLFHQLLLLIYAWANKNKFYSLKHCCSSTFFVRKNFVTFNITDCSLLNVISCCLNPNPDLNPIASGVDTLNLIIMGIIILHEHTKIFHYRLNLMHFFYIFEFVVL